MEIDQKAEDNLLIDKNNGETLDDLLIDDLKIIQNEKYYKFTSDSVLLSKFVKCKANEVVADFCSGSGIVGLHFYALNKNLIKSVTLFEMQQNLALMSEKTIKYNNLLNFAVENVKIQDIDKKYNEAFSLILVNPPYEKGGFENIDYEKAICRKEITVNLGEILKSSARCLKFGGRLCMINRADRLSEVLTCFSINKIEPKRIQFVYGENKTIPYLIMVEGTKGGKGGIEILPNLINKR